MTFWACSRWLGAIAFLVFPLSHERAFGQESKSAQSTVAASDDHLPAGAVKRLGTSRLRHGSRVLALSYSPNGRILAAGGGDDPVRLWDAETGKEIRTVGDTWVNAMAFTPRGSVLATAGAFKTIHLWEVATGKEIRKLEGHQAAIKALALSPDGSMIASGGQDGTLLLWEVLWSKVITPFKGHTGEIDALAFSADSTLLASAGGDRSIRLWDCDNDRFVRAWDGLCAVGALVFSADGKLLISGGDDQMVRVWRVADGKLLHTLKGHTGSVVSLLARRDGKIVSSARDRAIRIWDLSNFNEVGRIARDIGDSDALAISKNNKFLACAGTNDTVRIFDAALEREIMPGSGQRAGVSAVALAPNGQYLVSGSAIGKIHLWDAKAGQEIRHWSCPVEAAVVLAISPDSRTVVSGAGSDAIRFWDPRTGRETMSLPAGGANPVLSLRYAPDGATVAVGRRFGAVELWDIKQKKIVQQYDYGAPAYALAFSKDGATLAASGGNKIDLFASATGKLLHAFNSKPDGSPAAMPAVASLAFSPDGTMLAVGCYDAVIRLLDAASGKEIRPLEGHGNVAYALAFSSDGRVLASASFDKTVRLWETFSGLPIAVYAGHKGPVTALAFLPSGREIFSGSADTSILHWDATGIAKNGALAAVHPSQAELKAAWLDLASLDAGRAYRALWRIVAMRSEAAPFLGGQIYLLDPKRVDRLFADLNSEKYKVRTDATKELERYGIWMKGRLLEVNKDPPTLEVQRRIDQMLAKLNVPGALTIEQERLRVRRVMLALEQVGGPEAAAILDKLIGGAPEADLQADARASRRRLGVR